MGDECVCTLIPYSFKSHLVSMFANISTLPRSNTGLQSKYFFLNKPLHDVEAEYLRISKVCSLLQMEEVITEVLVEEGRDAVICCQYQPTMQMLQDLRVLVGMAHQGLAFFKECCEEHSIHVDFAHLDQQHLHALKMDQHFQMLELFLDKSVGLKTFSWWMHEDEVTVFQVPRSMREVT
jgi:hypothetical protein